MIHWALLLTVVLLALWLRTDDLTAWQRQPQRAFYHGRPLLINFDGYYYLSLARDLTEGDYTPVDTLRGIPEVLPRPKPPPLISLLAAGLALITRCSLDWIATLLPAFLGLALAVPLYLISRLYGGRMMATIAVAMGLWAGYYVYRSNVGWFDTDSLNVTFVFLITYLFIRFGLEERRRRYGYLAAGGLTYALFMWWWDQAPAIVSLISLSPLMIMLLLYYRPQGKERWVALAVAVLVLMALLIWKGPQIFATPFKEMLQQWGYIAKQQAGDFPNVGVSVMEQKRLTLSDLIRSTTGHPIPFVFGCLGLIGFFWEHKRKASALIVPLLLGCLSFIFARRFLIFLNPFIAIGLGYSAQWLWAQRSKWSGMAYVAPVLAAVLVVLPLKQSFAHVYWPKEIPPIVEGMDVIAHRTPADAVVWAWWDHGYPLRYWGRRATINDGSLHGGLRTVCTAIPLVAPSPRLAANFMYFYTARGMNGLQKLFAAAGTPARGMQILEQALSVTPSQAETLIAQAGLPPEENWRDFMFPKPKRDIYLFLDLRLARTTYWWSWFGTWDAARRDGAHARFKLFRNCTPQGDRISGRGIRVDLVQGWVDLDDKRYPLTKVLLNDGRKLSETDYAHPNGLVFAYRSDSKSAALMDQAFTSTLFNQLFMLNQADPRFFSLISAVSPYYQIWQVHLPRSDQ